MLVLWDQMQNILLICFEWTYMSPLGRSGFFKNGFCMDDSTLERSFCFDILHITDVWCSVFLWLFLPVFEALRWQAVGSLQAVLSFPIVCFVETCFVWRTEQNCFDSFLSFFTNNSFSGQYLRFCCVLVSAVLSGVDEAVFFARVCLWLL